MQNVPKSVLKRLRETRPAAGSHPDADLLSAFAEQSLRERERSFVMEHLAACSDCREVIVLALPETATEIVRSPASLGAARGGWLTWPALRWVALAAGILVIASVGVFEYSHRHPGSGMASNSMLKDAAPAPSNEPPSSKVATPEEDKQNEPLSAPRSHRLTAHEAASKAMDGTEPRGLAAYSGGSGGGRAPLGVPSRGETGAISECVDHSHLCDATDPDAWRRARQIASSDSFKGASPAEAVAMIEDIMASIGDTCPECK